MAAAQRPLATPGRHLSSYSIVEFPSEGATLRGRLYAWRYRSRGPAVIMSHGFSATVTGMVADKYAEVLHAAGLTVLLFDHRSFGMSGGVPRQQLNLWVQARAYRDALAFLRSRPGMAAARVALWGDSFSAGAAILAAAATGDPQAVVFQVPAFGSQPSSPDRDGSLFDSLRATFERGSVEGSAETTTGPLAVVSADQIGSPSLLEPITAFRWFIDYGGRPGTGWQNRATFVEPVVPVRYHAALCAPHLRGASLWVIAADDEMPGAEPEIALLAYEAAPQPKELLTIDGGHFGLLYHPSELFDRVSAAQADFLTRHLQ